MSIAGLLRELNFMRFTEDPESIMNSQISLNLSEEILMLGKKVISLLLREVASLSASEYGEEQIEVKSDVETSVSVELNDPVVG